VRANVLAIDGGDNRCLSIGTGQGTTVNTIFNTLCSVLHLSIEPRHSPRRPGDLRTAIFDSTLAFKELGWKPTVFLEDGLRNTVDYCRSEIGTRRPEPVAIGGR